VSPLAAWQAVAVLALAASAEPPPPKRTAVLIVSVAPEDTELAENITEVAISELADRGRGELVGTPELRRFLERSETQPDVIGCARDGACLRRIAQALAVDKFVTGTLHRDEDGFLLELSVVDPASGVVERRLERATKGLAVESLVRAVQEGLEALFAPAPLPALRPLRDQSPASSQDATIILQRRNVEDAPPRRRWAPHVAYGSAGAALLSFAAAGIFGTLANADPSGSTRATAQRDLELRERYATTANRLLIAGSVLGAVSAAAFVLLWRDLSVD
jgi:hypothetical protein